MKNPLHQKLADLENNGDLETLVSHCSQLLALNPNDEFVIDKFLDALEFLGNEKKTITRVLELFSRKSLSTDTFQIVVGRAVKFLNPEILLRCIGTNSHIAPMFFGLEAKQTEMMVLQADESHFLDLISRISSVENLQEASLSKMVLLAFGANRLRAAQALVSLQIQVDPNNPIYWNNLAHAKNLMEDPAGAVACLSSAIENQPDPNSAKVLHKNRGRLNMALARHRAAVKDFRKTLSLDPTDMETRCFLSLALIELGEFQAACQEILPENGFSATNPAVAFEAAKVCYSLRKPLDALRHIRQARADEKLHADILVTAGLIALEAGHFRYAEKFFCRSNDLSPGYLPAVANLSMVKKYKTGDKNFGVLERAVRINEGNRESYKLHFSLAMMYDDCGNTDMAKAHYKLGNAMKKKYMDYDESANAGQLAGMSHFFEAFEFSPSVQPPSNVPIQPVFILGLPRSGSTLLENLMCKHLGCATVGEDLFFFRHLSTEQDDKGTFKLIRPENLQIEDLRQKYLEHLKFHGAIGGPVINKMPDNITILGYIKLIFPEAIFIDIQRGFMDTAVSIYKCCFSESISYASDFQQIGAHFTLYCDYLQFWKNKGIEIFTVPYEDFVTDVEGHLDDLARRTHLADHHHDEHARQPAAIKTASLFQVRQPVNSSSVASWKKYTGLFDPDLPAQMEKLEQRRSG